MAAKESYILTIIILIGVCAIISVTLNATTLGVVVKRLNRLENIYDNQPSITTTTSNPIPLNSSLVEAIRINDVMTHLSEFYRIAMMENGTRSTNTTGFNRTLDYITDYLSTHTNYRVQKTYFPIRMFKLENDPIFITSINGTIKNRNYSKNLRIAEFYNVQYSTPINLPDFISLTLIQNFGCSNDDWLNSNPLPTGHVALVKRGMCEFHEKITLAMKYQVKALLIYNDGVSSNRYEPMPIGLDPTNELPILSLSFTLGQELANALENAATNATVRIVIDLADNPPLISANICADTPTGDITQTIVIGSHSDSVPTGPGINDNGSGSAANLALAVALFQTSIYSRLKYRVRFCWWGAEELGLLGADFYVRQAKNSTNIGERISDHLLNLNFDMLGSPNYVFGIYDGQTITNTTPANAVPGSNKITGLFRDWFNNQNLPWSNSTLGSGSDYAPFLAAGIAAGGLLSGASRIKTKEDCDRYALLLGPDPYCIPNIAQDPCYHRSCDTIWNINVFAFEKMVKAAAYVIESLVNRNDLKEWLYPTKEIQYLKVHYRSKRKYNSVNDFFGLAYV